MCFTENDSCPKCQEGILTYPEVENCSCHINPPCQACVDNLLTCNVCDYQPELEEEENGKE